VEFDVAPYFYHKNDRTYVPVRAISELLSKKIMWEESTTTVYIRDAANYEATLDLLKRISGSKAATKIKTESTGTVNVSIKTDNTPFNGADGDGVLRMKMDISQLIMSDLDAGVSHIKQVTGIEGTNIGTEVFISNGKVFTKVEGSGGGWTENTGNSAFDLNSMNVSIDMLESQINARDLSDVAMGLAVSVGSDGSYMLVGEPVAITDVNAMLDIIAALLPNDDPTAYSMKFNSLLMATVYDDQLYPVSSGVISDIDFSIKEKTDNGEYVTIFFKMEMNQTVKYDKTGPDFTVPIPEGLAGLV
jgi:hypothetical protein